MVVLNGVNKILSHIQSNSFAKGLQVDFSSNTKDEHESGLYNQEGNLIGILEGKNSDFSIWCPCLLPCLLIVVETRFLVLQQQTCWSVYEYFLLFYVL